MKKPYVVLFAGVPGVSKTPIAHYLSCDFGLPVFSTDQIRYEVMEDLRLDDINKPGGIEEYERRQNQRFKQVLASGKPFIFDGSMDRRWEELKPHYVRAGYSWFMINIELTKPFLQKLYDDTGRAQWAEEHLDSYLAQHKDFVRRYSADISLEINDDTFRYRLRDAADGLRNFLKPQ